MAAVKPVRRTQAQRRETSQARILDASLKLLVERGYDRFSLQDVGRLAGCSYELVNHYFGNKDGLLTALAEHIVDSFATDGLEIPPLANGFENLVQRIRYYAAVAERDFVTFRAYMIVAGEAPSRPTVADFVLKVRDRTLSTLLDAMTEGQAKGDIRSDIDAEEYVKLIYEFVRGHADVSVVTNSADVARRAVRGSSSVDLFVEILRPAISKPRKARFFPVRSGASQPKTTSDQPAQGRSKTAK